jgi:hypothetical protein
LGPSLVSGAWSGCPAGSFVVLPGGRVFSATSLSSPRSWLGGVDAGWADQLRLRVQRMPAVWVCYELRLTVVLRGEVIFRRVCRYVQILLGSRQPGPLRLIFLVRELRLDWESVHPPYGYQEHEEIPHEEVDDFCARYVGPSSFFSSGFVEDGPDEAR